MNVKRDRLENMLWKRGIDCARPKGAKQNVEMVCPRCGGGTKHEKSLSLSLLDGQFTCNRKNNCGWQGSIIDLCEELGEDWKALLQENPHGVTAIEAPRHYKAPEATRTEETFPRPEWISFFQKRGISAETVDAWGVKGAICRGKTVKDGKEREYAIKALAFEVYDAEGKLVNIKWRMLEKKRFWNEADALKIPWGMHKLWPGCKTVMLIEGEMDLLAAVEYGLGTPESGIGLLSLPNGVGDQDWITHLWDWLETLDVIYLCCDSDVAGREAVEKLAARLKPWRCRDMQLPFKDLNECLMQGLPSEAIDLLIEEARDFRPQKIKTVHDFVARVKDLFAHPEKRIGVKTSLPSLTRLLSGWRWGELTVWTGRNGSGKSTMLGQEIVHQLAAGHKVCVASLEMEASRYLYWLFLQSGATVLSTESQLDAIARTLDGLILIDHVGSMNMRELTELMEYVARRYGAKFFFVDSLVKLALRIDDYDQQRASMDALSTFADVYDCHVHLVAHPRKGGSDDEDVDKVGIKGDSSIADLADNIVAISRNFEPVPGEADGVAKLMKNREHGRQGKIPLFFNEGTKRFSDEAPAVFRSEAPAQPAPPTPTKNAKSVAQQMGLKM